MNPTNNFYILTFLFGYDYSFSSIFGILDIDGKLFMVPLKN